MSDVLEENERESRKEKRISNRYSYNAFLSYTVMGDFLQPPNVINVRGNMLDISNTGMRFQIDERPPKKGSVLCIRVDVNFANVVVTLPVLVEIKWVKEVSANKHYLGGRFMV